MIILISGKQGSGKTTTANALVNALNKIKSTRAWHLTFAEPLYQMHDFCWGMLKDHGIDMPYKKDGYLLQMLGTEWGRKVVDENIWVRLMKAKLIRLEMGMGQSFARNYFVISDLRFRNEFEAFRKTGLSVRLSCDRDLRKQRAEMWRETEEHISEIDLDNYAQDGQFSFYFNTETQSTEEIVQRFLDVEREIINPSSDQEQKKEM